MARILIGNIKGPQGEQGPQGVQGPVGPQGPQGPLPPLVNNALATEAGVAALDAAMGKTLQDQITNNKNDITQLNSNLWYTASDLNDLPSTVRFFKYPANTPNAPTVSAGVGVRMYYDTNFSAQIAAGYGEDPKFRTSVNGEFRDWKSFTMSS